VASPIRDRQLQDTDVHLKSAACLPAAFLTVALLAACAAGQPPGDTLPVFKAADLSRHTQVLASDEFEGRRPATAGEEKTVAYIEQAYRQAGLQPGVNGSFRQAVPFVELSTRPADTLDIEGNGKAFSLKYGDQAVYWTKRVVNEIKLERSELVFVGYGIDEPAMSWHDYAGVDMKGKTAVILINDPGFATNDPALFKGRAMTYHGRWIYKFEEAARHGAAGAIIVHEEAPAAYPWEVVRNGAARPQLVIDTPDGGASRIGVEGWVTRDAAVRLFAAAGMDYDELKAKAAVRGFKPVPMGLTASTWVRNAVRRASSSNVIGVLPGTKRPDEYVIMTAHWDHLGRALAFSGDAIFNGAVDNATGTAGLLELARAFGEVRPRPERSVLFVAFTGEEYGLLGSEYFAEHPTVPLAKVAGGVNIDGMSVNGRTRDVTVVGFGASELEDELKAVVAKQGRVLQPEPTPEKGYYYRSDHFNLARKGVPMLYAKSGIDSVAHGAKWGLDQQIDYVANRYHKPSDEFDPNWDLSGALEDLQAYFEVGYRLSREKTFPQWYPGNEFRPIRERSLAAAAAAAAAGH
jgi:Zn-dependent M28 family amino/carboxypeptidase